MIEYCILHEGRCGSTVIGGLLDAIPGVAHHGEILQDNVWIGPGFDGTPFARRRAERAIPLAELGAFVEAVRPFHAKVRRGAPVVAYGYEIKFSHVTNLLAASFDEFERLFMRPSGVRFVFVMRRNALRQHVSALRAMATRQWHAAVGEAVADARVAIDVRKLHDMAYYPSAPYTLAQFLEVRELNQAAMVALAGRTGSPVIFYDDYADRIADAARVVLGALDIEASPPAPAYRRTGEGAIDDLVENADAVRAALAGSRFAWMAEDPGATHAGTSAGRASDADAVAQSG